MKIELCEPYTLSNADSLLQGSGSNVDICIITADKTEYIRPYDVANTKGERLGIECIACATGLRDMQYCEVEGWDYQLVVGSI